MSVSNNGPSLQPPWPEAPWQSSGNRHRAEAAVWNNADGDEAPEAPATPLAADSPVDQARIRRAVREILLAVGEDPDREGLLETPARVARMYAEVFRGLREDPRDYLRKLFTEEYDETVLIRDITFSSFCEHHLLPFFGKVHVAYQPNGRVVGLSKIPRVIESLSRRPQVQERLTADLADLLFSELDARGVAVAVWGEHTCMTVRGVRQPGSECWTHALRGTFQNDPAARADVMALLRGT